MPNRRNVIAAMLGACGPVAFASSPPSIEVWVEQRTDTPGIDLDALSSDLRALGAVEIARVRQPSPAIAVRVDPARLDAIRQLPAVRRVRPARVLHPPTPGSSPGTG
jgi:hypothetical protein